jgi:hypothetical protein
LGLTGGLPIAAPRRRGRVNRTEPGKHPAALDEAHAMTPTPTRPRRCYYCQAPATATIDRHHACGPCVERFARGRAIQAIERDKAATGGLCVVMGCTEPATDDGGGFRGGKPMCDDHGASRRAWAQVARQDAAWLRLMTPIHSGLGRMHTWAVNHPPGDGAAEKGVAAALALRDACAAFVAAVDGCNDALPEPEWTRGIRA